MSRGRLVVFAAAVALTVPMAGTLAEAEADVPTPPVGSSVINVKVGGVRDGGSIHGVEGTTLHLYVGSANAVGARIEEEWATCTSDEDGDCNFVIPNTEVGGANRDRRFYIKEESAPTGYYTNPRMMTSNGGEMEYVMRTGLELRAGVTYPSTSFPVTATGGRSSTGIWPESLNNPALSATCGLNIALVLDLSNSVFMFRGEGDTHGDDYLKSAASGLTDALVGTSSQIGLFTFAAFAPAGGETNVNRPLTPVSTQAGADTVKAWINGLTTAKRTDPLIGPGSTNWDRGLYQVAQQQHELSAKLYDVAIVLTDGDPTRFGLAGGDGNNTRFAEVEQAVFSANAIKDKGTRVVVVGVGAAGESIPNLAAISGPRADSDYYAVSWEKAAETLQGLALTGCVAEPQAASLTVIKQVVPEGAVSPDVSGATLQGGWKMNVSASAEEASIGTPSAATGVQTGAMSTTVTFAEGVTQASVSVDEDVSGQVAPLNTYQPFPVDGGRSAKCVLLSEKGANGQPVVLPVNGSGEEFTVELEPGDIASCTVYNQIPSQAPSPLPASVRVDKQWIINGVAYAEGTQPTGFSSSYTINDETNSVTHSGLSWGSVYTGFWEGQEGELVESVALPAGCSWDEDGAETSTSPTDSTPQGFAGVTMERTGSGAEGPYNLDVPAPNGGGDSLTQHRYTVTSYSDVLDPGDNTWKVTNRVSCETKLVLVKYVLTPSTFVTTPLDPQSWTLTATEQVLTGVDPETGEPTLVPGDPLTGTWVDLPICTPDQDPSIDPCFPEGYAMSIELDVQSQRSYVLAESSTDPASGAYTQGVAEEFTGHLTKGASGSWECVPVATDGTVGNFYTEAYSGMLTIPYDAPMVMCAATNATAEFTAEKTVTGGTASADAWSYTLVPSGTIADGAPLITGGEWGTAYQVRPRQQYTIAESTGPEGYTLTDVRCSWWEPVGDDGVEYIEHVDESVIDTMTLELMPTSRATCTFVNTYTGISPNLPGGAPLGGGSTSSGGPSLTWAIVLVGAGCWFGFRYRHAIR